MVHRIGWQRAAVLGANDGAMSMAAGGGVRVSSQTDAAQADLARETKVRCPPKDRRVTDATIRRLPVCRHDEIRMGRTAGTTMRRSRRVQPRRRCTVSDPADEQGVHPTMIRQWERSLPEGSAGIFARGGKAVVVAKVAEETVRDLHAKMGEMAVAHGFLSRRLAPWIGTRGTA